MAGFCYEFIGEVDYALRGAVDGRDQLGMVLSKRRGIMSQVSRIKNICEGDLKLDSQQLKSAQKMMAGSLLLRCVQMLEFHNDKPASLEIWKIARDHRLIALSTYLLGLLWIKKYKSVLGDMAAYLINYLESDNFLLKNRAPIGSIPLSCLSETSYDGRFHRQGPFVKSSAIDKGLFCYLVDKLKSKASRILAV